MSAGPGLFFLFAVAYAAPADPVSDAAAQIPRLGADRFEERQQASELLAKTCALLEQEGKRSDLARLAAALAACETGGVPEAADRARRILAPYRAGATLSESLPGSIANGYAPVEPDGVLVLWEGRRDAVRHSPPEPENASGKKRPATSPDRSIRPARPPEGFSWPGSRPGTDPAGVT